MKIIEGYQTIAEPLPTPVITLGNFDGVHLGHQKILASIRERARALNGTSMVYTFDPHPMSVLTEGTQQPPAITTLEEKIDLIARLGIDVVICETFTAAFAQITAEQFGHDILCRRIGAKEIYVGEDYRFGSKRQGDIHYLRKLGKECDFRVRIVESIVTDGIIVKSSKIRQFIATGDVATAARLLGRPYLLTGRVVTGRQRGAKLGFPTANIKPNKSLHPAEGVYAVWVVHQGRFYMGAMNIGRNPTFKESNLSLEVYILDFNKDIYDERLEIHFIRRIRGEKAFPSADMLVEQMRSDIAEVREILARTPAPASAQARVQDEGTSHA